MKRYRPAFVFVELTRFLLIILMLYTGLSKLIEHNKFQIILYATGMLRANPAHAIAYVIPVAECVIATALIVPRWKVAGLGAATILMGGFTMYVAAMLLFASKLPCSCGGIISTMTWPQHLSFNSLFTIAGLVAFRLSIRHQLFIAINRRSRIPV